MNKEARSLGVAKTIIDTSGVNKLPRGDLVSKRRVV
jgi:hypothetical protein